MELTREQVEQNLRNQGVAESQISRAADKVAERLGVTFTEQGFLAKNKNILSEIGGQVGADIGLSTLVKRSPAGAVGGLLFNLLRGGVSSSVGNVAANVAGAGREGEGVGQAITRGGFEGVIGSGLSKIATGLFKGSKVFNKGKELVNETPLVKKDLNFSGKGATNLPPDIEKNVLQTLFENKKLKKFPIQSTNPPAGGTFGETIKSSLLTKATPLIKRQVLTFKKDVDARFNDLIGTGSSVSAFNEGFRKSFNTFKDKLKETTSKEFGKLRETPADFSELTKAFNSTQAKLQPLFTQKDQFAGLEAKKAFKEIKGFFEDKLADTGKITEKSTNDLFSLFNPSEDLAPSAVKEVIAKLRSSIGEIPFGSASAKKALKLKNIIIGGKDKLPENVITETERSTANFLRTLARPGFTPSQIGTSFSKADPKAITEMGAIIGKDLSKSLFQRFISGTANSRLKKTIIGDLDNVDDKARLLALVRNFKGKGAEKFLNDVQGAAVLKGIITAFETGKPFQALSLPTLLIGSNAVNIIEQVFKVNRPTASLLGVGAGIIFKKSIENGIDFNKFVSKLGEKTREVGLSKLERALTFSLRSGGIAGVKKLDETNR